MNNVEKQRLDTTVNFVQPQQRASKTDDGISDTRHASTWQQSPFLACCVLHVKCCAGTAGWHFHGGIGI
jgi:hypothetical protein